MSRNIISLAALTGLLLTVWGCEPKTGAESQPSLATQGETAPAEVNAIVAPKPAELFQEQVKPEPKIASEPKPQENVTPEPNAQHTAIKPAAKESPAEPQKPAEPNATAAELCGICTQFLSKYVDPEGYVDYKTLSRRKIELIDVLDKFKQLDRNDYNLWPRDDKIAFWINAYNLELIKIILDNYPIQSTRILRLFWPPNSIRHIKGIWDEHKFIIMEEEFTLREIDRRFFVGEFDEPRAFFAIHYASVSGPPLKNEAYCGRNLSEQLDEQVKRFLAGKQAFKIERQNQMVYLSSIFSTSWQGQKFVSKYGTDLKFKHQEQAIRAVLNFLSRYVSTGDVNYLETGNYRVDFIGYDWTLIERMSQ
jgi:hypothetical protein